VRFVLAIRTSKGQDLESKKVRMALSGLWLCFSGQTL